MAIERNMALTGQPPVSINTTQKIGVLVGMAGLFILVLATLGVNLGSPALWLTISLLAIGGGIVIFSKGAYAHKLPGIKNDGVWFKSMTSKGLLGWIAGIVLTGFYVILYFYAELLGLGQGADGTNTGLVGLFDPLSRALSGNPASQWFVYGTLYTVAIIAFGVKFMWKYKHNRYEQLRTVSVMFFQTAFAFVIPELMARLNSDDFSLPYNDLKNIVAVKLLCIRSMACRSIYKRAKYWIIFSHSRCINGICHFSISNLQIWETLVL